MKPYTHIIVRYDRVNRYSTEVVYDAVSYTDAARTMRLLMRAAARTQSTALYAIRDYALRAHYASHPYLRSP